MVVFETYIASSVHCVKFENKIDVSLEIYEEDEAIQLLTFTIRIDGKELCGTYIF